MPHQNTQKIKIGEHSIILRQNQRARRLTLRHNTREGFVLSHPPMLPRYQLEHFIQKHQAWLDHHLVPPITPKIGDAFPVWGDLREIRPSLTKKITLHPEYVELPQTHIGPSLRALLLDEATKFARTQIDMYAHRLDAVCLSLRFRDTHTRWGSCDKNGRIMLSWRLAMATPKIMDYVVAHEAAHLVHMNHSKAYWALLGTLMPNYPATKQNLRQIGRDLQRYDFS